MSKAIDRFQAFFKPKDDGLARVRRKPPQYEKDESERHRKKVPPAEDAPPDDLRERSSRYLGLLVSGNVSGLLESIVQDLDKEQILLEVEALRAKHPRMSDAKLCDALIAKASNTMSVAAVASGLAWAVPGVGIATGSLATAAELVAMIVYQSRLVVSIAAVHGVDIRAKERSRDVVVCIASSTAGTAVQMGVQAAVRALTERIAAALARRTATALVKSIPIAGTVAGLVGGAAGAVFNRWAVKAVGRYAVRFYGGKRRSKRVPPVASKS